MMDDNPNKRYWIIAGILVVIVFLFVISSNNYSMTGEAIGQRPQCNDKIDNDGDGYCDFLTRKTTCIDGSIPGDVDCGSKDDNREAADCEPVPERCDGYDNDCDGLVDENLPITCSSPSDCGTSGWTGNTYCSSDGHVHRDWISYTCNFPGTCSSSCSSQTTDNIYQYCSNGCFNGQCIGGNQTGNTTG